jgi:hypothetical protein
MNKSEPEIGAFYYHYKHTDDSVNNYAYEVIGIGHHTEIEGLEESAMVIYRPLYESAGVYKIGKHYDVRPLAMFMEPVEKEGKILPRFTKITDEKIIAELVEIKNQMYTSSQR